jgi:hypothetical protein
MERRREWLLASMTVAGSLITCLLFAEAVLRFLPVASGMRTVQVTAQNPVFHFTPNREFLFSRDGDMVLARRGRVNNAGFVNDQDYHKDDELPLLAVVGDSMIEAAMLTHRDTLQGRLAKSLAGTLRVYSFAAAGAPLSQYLIWARHAVQNYGAQALIFTVISNDYDESHSAYKTGPGFWRYVPGANGDLELRLFEYRPGLLRNAVLTSALARYLVFNLQLGERWLEFKSLMSSGIAMAETRHDASVSDDDRKRIQASIAAVDAFFRDLPLYAGLPRSRILFVVEGFRYSDLAVASRGGYFDRVRQAFLERAATLGYDTIDLDPLFFEHYRRTGERVEFPRDGHWTSAYHGVAANAVMGSQFMSLLVAEPTHSAKP